MVLSMTSIMLWFEYYDYQTSKTLIFPSVTNIYNYLISCSYTKLVTQPHSMFTAVATVLPMAQIFVMEIAKPRQT